MAGTLHAGSEGIVSDSEAWPLQRVLRWMQDHGERVELTWNIDTDKWLCVWSAHEMTCVGEGREPHQAAIGALLESQG